MLRLPASPEPVTFEFVLTVFLVLRIFSDTQQYISFNKLTSVFYAFNDDKFRHNIVKVLSSSFRSKVSMVSST